jgi:hypothetical protein
MSKQIQLNDNKFTIVDDCDYETLTQYHWFITPDGCNPYACASESGRHLRMHRLIMNATEGQIVDHINGDTLDNRRSNLRVVTPSQNAMNRRRRSDNASGCVGVSYISTKQRWFAYITVDGKKKILGQFQEKEDAISARKNAEKIVFGEFARPDEHKERPYIPHSGVDHPIQNRIGKRNKTGKKGVKYATHRNKTNPYSVSITCNRKSIHLGYFKTFEEACAAREKAERQYFPQYFKQT